MEKKVGRSSSHALEKTKAHYLPSEKAKIVEKLCMKKYFLPASRVHASLF